jgi:hypothetical protein
MEKRSFKLCKDCDGEGIISIGPTCNYPASMFCVGCYDDVECDSCKGRGEIEDIDD